MKVLHVTPVFYPAHSDGGPIVAFHELCKGLADLSCDVRVLTTNTHGWSKSLAVATDQEIEVEPNLRIRYCKRRFRRSVAPMMLRLLHEYVEWAEVVHLQSVYNFPTIPTLVICRVLGKPVVWSPDGALQRWKGTRRTREKAMWNWICQRVGPKRMTIHCTSQQEAFDSHKYFPASDVRIIPHSVPIPKVTKHIDMKDTLRLLYVGRFDPIKGLENLLAAFQLVNQEGKIGCSLTIAGDGDNSYARRLKSTIKRCAFTLGDREGKSGQVTMVGYLIGDAKEQLFQNADILVVPSHSESFGVVVVEALVREVPVIASTGTPWQQLEKIKCGMWVNNDPRSLAEAIKHMKNMPLREMGERGRGWATTEFQRRNVATHMLSCYKHAAGLI
jgi:glycosyltransferase involved in cell wall biosynthesis